MGWEQNCSYIPINEGTILAYDVEAVAWIVICMKEEWLFFFAVVCYETVVSQSCATSRYLVTQLNKFCMAVPVISGYSVWNFLHTTFFGVSDFVNVNDA
jgi:hypothetical protein